MQNIITLTTIPPRFASILPTLRSLCDQDADISRVILTIPRSYQKRQFDAATLPDLPNGVEVLHVENDMGPATKILPAVEHFRGQDVRLLYCDDDRIYHQDWAARLIAHHEKQPDMCIVDAGDPIAAIDRRTQWNTPFNHRLNTLTLGLSGKPHRRRVRRLIPDTGVVDIAKGYGGVLVQPSYFDADAFQIPDACWAVDDVWLSGQMARLGVGVFKVGRQPKSVRTRSGKMSTLLNLTLEGLGREELNSVCVNYFRTHYGIWGGPEAVQGNV